jgi:hypothetical protein
MWHLPAQPERVTSSLLTQRFCVFSWADIFGQATVLIGAVTLTYKCLNICLTANMA